MTKREAKQNKANWSKALVEGRVVRFGLSMTSYPTVEAAQTALAKIGEDASIVVVPADYIPYTLPNPSTRFDSDATRALQGGRQPPQAEAQGARMMKPEFSTMNGPQLVAAYNQIVGEIVEAGQPGAFRKVTKFADVATGAKRCEAAWSGLVAALDSAKAVESEEVSATAPEPAPLEEPVVAAKKVKAKKAKAPKVARAKTNGKAADGISAEFGCRAGSIREKLLLALHGEKSVMLKHLMAKLYGDQSADHRGPTMMVLKGLDLMIKKGRLPYSIIKMKDPETKEISYALQAE
jgi:hypothetical protein